MGWLGHPYEATRSTLQGRGCSLSVAGGGWVRSYASQLCATRLWASGRRHDRKSKQQDHIFLQSLSKLVDRACSARVMTCVAHMKLPDGAHHGDGGREAFRTFDPSPHGDEVPWPVAHASERFPRLVWAPRTRRGPSKKTPWFMVYGVGFAQLPFVPIHVEEQAHPPPAGATGGTTPARGVGPRFRDLFQAPLHWP